MKIDDRIVSFYLFRLVLVAGTKTYCVVESAINRAKLLEKIISLEPHAKFPDGKQYIFAKATKFDTNTLYFKFGLKKQVKAAEYDEINNDFIDKDKDDTNYVHCFFSADEQLLAIEKKKGLPPPKTLANRIADLIGFVVKIDDYKTHISNEEKIFLLSHQCKSRIVFEPAVFIEKIKAAHKISWYKVTMSLPNPFDFNDKIKEPMDKFMEATGATSSDIKVVNPIEGLEPNRLIPLTQEIAAYGAGATARIQKTEDSKYENIKLDRDENASHVEILLPKTMLSVNFSDDLPYFLRKIIDKYHSIKK